MGLLRRQLRLVLAVTFSITAVVALITLQLTPIYESSALMIVDPRQTNILDPQSQVSLLPGDAARVESEVGMLRSPSVLLAVIRDLKLTSDPEFAPQAGWRTWFKNVIGLPTKTMSAADVLNRTLEKLQSIVSIDRRGLTYLIDVKARSANPQKAATIANAVANAHIRLQIAAKVAVATGIRGALSQEASQTGISLTQSEVRLDAFYDRSIDSVVDPVRREQLRELRQQAEASRAERRAAEAAVASASLALRSADWQSLVADLESQALRELNHSRTQLMEQINRAEDAGDPTVDLRGQLASLEADMARRAHDAISQAQTRIETERSSGSALENTFRQQLISELPPESVAELRQLQQDALAASGVYDDLVSREKAVAAQQNLQVPDSRVVSDAIPTASAAFPRKKLIVALAGLGSLALALGLAFLRENYIGGFVDEEQTEAVLGTPVLASVPELARGGDELAESIEHASEIVAHPLSAYSEAIRRTRLGLDVALADGASEEKSPVQVIVVTSALPAEGKSQTAISLARAYALAGKKVVLMDADLRRPTVHTALELRPEGGLSDVLAGPSNMAAVLDLMHKDPMSEAWILPGSPVRHTATAQLLESSRVDALIRALGKTFDVVIIDTSPVLPVVDARLLLRFASAVVLVVRWAQTSQRDARAALNDLVRHNRNNALIATVLNRVEKTAVGYGYGRYYAPYYLDDGK